MQGFGMEGKFENDKEDKTDSSLKILLLGKENNKADKYRNKVSSYYFIKMVLNLFRDANVRNSPSTSEISDGRM